MFLGKTRVLTCRIAHLVSHHKVPPRDIVAVTFTNKTAREMEHRLKLLLGEGITQDLILGSSLASLFRLSCGSLLLVRLSSSLPSYLTHTIPYRPG